MLHPTSSSHKQKLAEPKIQSSAYPERATGVAPACTCIEIQGRVPCVMLYCRLPTCDIQYFGVSRQRVSVVAPPNKEGMNSERTHEVVVSREQGSEPTVVLNSPFLTSQ